MIRNQDGKEMDDCFSTNLRKNRDSLDFHEWISEIKKRLTLSFSNPNQTFSKPKPLDVQESENHPIIMEICIRDLYRLDWGCC